MNNKEIAQHLLDHARELEHRDGNLFRVRAYRTAAGVIADHPRPLAGILEDEGRKGLASIRGVGRQLSCALDALIRTGTIRDDDATVAPDRLLTSVPGVGNELARRLREELHITSLEELELAVHDGRLGAVGVGPKRLRGIQDALAVRLGRLPASRKTDDEPSVAELLEIDAEFRKLIERHATVDQDKTTARRRSRMLVVGCGGWQFRAHYADTALAHRLGATRDWVIIDFQDKRRTGQRTVVTETRGPQAGRRVVRGREDECRDLQNVSPGASVPGDDSLQPHGLCASVCAL